MSSCARNGLRYGRGIRVLSTSDGELAALVFSPFAAETLSDPGGLVVVTTPDGDGSVSDGSVGDGSDGDGSVSDGSVGDGSDGDGSVGDGSVGDGSVGDGSDGDREVMDRLASLPCVVVAVDRSPGDRPPLADVTTEEGVGSLEEILRMVEHNPVAATSLALCLRQTPPSLGRALVAESATYSLLQAGPEFAQWRAARPVREGRAQGGPAVRVERHDDRLDLILNRPQVRNALNGALRDGLLEGLALAAADPSLAQVVLRGEGPSFCSGGDLDEFGSLTDPASAHLVRLEASIGRSIDALGPRMMAYVHGACAGSGVELPAFAHRVIARPDFSAALPEVGLGLIPGAGGTASITRRVGRHRMALLALSGARIDAATSLAWGLVDEITDGEGRAQTA